MSVITHPPTTAGASGPAGGDLTGTYPNPTIGTAKVTYAKIQDISAASRLLGRGSAAGSGVTQEITLGAGITMSGTALQVSSAPVVAGAIGLIQMVRQTNYQM